MRENFYEHYDTFNLLVKMQKEDEKFSSIADTWTEIGVLPEMRSSFENYEQDISKERWDAYRGLFKKAGIESGMRRHYIVGREVRDVKFFEGVSSFGFTYREKPPSPLAVFKSFRECRAIKYDHQYRCYVHLKDNWYLHMGKNYEPRE